MHRIVIYSNNVIQYWMQLRVKVSDWYQLSESVHLMFNVPLHKHQVF